MDAKLGLRAVQKQATNIYSHAVGRRAVSVTQKEQIPTYEKCGQ